MEQKQCTGPYGKIKDIDQFYFRKDRNEFVKKCKECIAEYQEQYQKQYYKENQKDLSEKHKLYYQENKEDLAVKKTQYIEENKEDILERTKQYKEKNKEDLAEYHKQYQKERYQEDPEFRLRTIISGSINHMLKANGSSKAGQSILQFLPPNFMEDLKARFESLWEPWMNWENHGVYRLDTYMEDDSTTWTWHLDHKIPHISFKYQTMDSQEFRDCWKLENLQPLKSIDNIKKGARII